MTLFEMPSDRKSPKQLAVAKALRDHRVTMSVDDVAAVAGISRKEAANTLARMRTALRAQRIGDGYWGITKGGLAWLAMQEVRNG